MMGFGSTAVYGRSTGFRSKSYQSGTSPGASWRTYPAALQAAIERLQGVTIENLPALELIEKYDGPGVLFYLDPPYVGSTRTMRRKGRMYRHEMSDQEHRDLSVLLERVQGRVVLSGYDCRLYDELYGGGSGSSG
jgi:DNA adenine methylase